MTSMGNAFENPMQHITNEQVRVDLADNDVPVSTMTTTSLEALQSSEQRELMDLVGRLRRSGLSSFLQLPQIVVCGDQSSGKSSVLEAITEIPFPRKENLCTRFATEISLRCGAESSISCKINPDEGRSDEEKDKLHKFSKSIENFGDLPSLIDEATAVMGLGPSKAFSKDVLCIEICGPDRPQLTLIDLPGLIHSSNKSQSEEDVVLIKSLVENYISKQRTIILAVISAKNDYANQIILKMCRKFDAKGARTLGIITKPDYLRANSDNEAAWLDLARNRDVYFELGWHLLKNRNDDQHNLSFVERNNQETLFFRTGNYSSLPHHMTGITTLRERLSQLLFRHLKQGLPDLKDELDDMVTVTSEELDSLGKKRVSPAEQRIYLAELATSTSNILRMGLDGNYENSFFGKIDITVPVDGKQNHLRLRAVIQYLNVRFAAKMHSHGQTYNISKESDSDSEDIFKTNKGKAKEHPNKPVKLTRQHAIGWVISILERIRGRELPGLFNPMVIGHLFHDQSKSWESIARNHIDVVAAACKKFALHVVDHFSASEVKVRLCALTVMPALKYAHEAATRELGFILEDSQRHPITYNHYFTDTFQKLQQDRLTGRLMKRTEDATLMVAQKTFVGGPGFEDKRYIDPIILERDLKRTVEQDMEKFAAEQALDAFHAYYKDEKKYFINVITKQVVERHLLAPLAEILSPKVMAGYSDSQIHHVAAEPSETMYLRAHLESKKKMLEDGQKAFHNTIGLES